MRILSLNVNGLRSAAAKGFFTWLPRQRVDVACLQEIRADLEQLEPKIARPRGWHCHHHPAEKKGYSGVAIYSRQAPLRVRHGLGVPELDREGRWLEVDFERLTVVSLYVPSGSSGEERQRFKLAALAELTRQLDRRLASGRQYVVCGDFNIAHTPMDIENWRSNQKNSGFLPEERAWLDELLAEGRWVDAFRRLNRNPREYSWWSNRGNAWANNVGWRIDYQLVTPGLAPRLTAARIHRDHRFSDHAPVLIDYAL